MNMKKLSNIISKLQVGKTRRNDFSKYEYRNVEDIWSGLKPLTGQYGVLVIATDSIEVIGDRYYVKATIRCYDIEDGGLIAENSAYAREPLSKKGMDDGMLTGSASSYARKYALGGMFNLAITEDPDEVKHEEQKAAAKSVSKRLTERGINPDDFAKLIFGVEFGEMTAANIERTNERFEAAVEKYAAKVREKQPEEKEYQQRFTHHQLAERLADRGIDCNDFAKLIFGVEFRAMPPEQVDYSYANFEEAMVAYSKADAARPMGA